MSRSYKKLIFIFCLLIFIGGSCNPMNMVPMPEADGEVVFEDGIMIPMRDGVKLAGYLYHPPGKGPWPVIVNRLPYGLMSAEPMGKYFAGWGYAFLAQDVRGRYNSEGGGEIFYPFASEAKDGRDTLAWVEKQPWCNGKIGTWGGSYHGFTQWALAPGNPNLDAMAPLLTPTTVHSLYYMGGALRLEMMLGWGIKNLYRKANNFAGMPKKAVWHLPRIEADDVGKEDSPFWNDAVSHPTLDGFWKPMHVTDRIQDVNAPALFISGWYDIFNGDQLRDFIKWQQRGPDAPKARLVVGPWTHTFYNTNLKNVEWGWDDAAENILVPCREWFDCWLKDQCQAVDDSAPVKIYVMGEGRWREYDTWPPKNSKNVNLYLRSSGGANTLNGDGQLSYDTSPGKEKADKFVYDPKNPVPTIGGAGLVPWSAGPADQTKIEKRSDVLVYSSPVIEKPVIIIGSVKVKLFASTSAVDTDFTAKLVDVYPNGKAIIVTEGILRGRYREGDTAKMLTPGEVYEWNIDMGFTALKVNPGHRIRLEISSSSFPRFDRNLNTGENQATGTRIKTANQTVFHTKEYPSRLILGVVGN